MYFSIFNLKKTEDIIKAPFEIFNNIDIVNDNCNNEKIYGIIQNNSETS